MNHLTLSADELHDITGYRTAAKQIESLHLAGFYRARLGPTGGVILERAHYESVCAENAAPKRPKVLPPRNAPRVHGQTRLAA